jgi:methylsterol monooxygenase
LFFFRFNECFGALGILDWLHGTDKLFRQLPNGKRHIFLRKLMPVREIFPDKEDKKL